MKYLFKNSISGRRARAKLFNIGIIKKIDWRMISHAFTVALAVIGVVLLAWVGVVAYLIALSGKYN